MFCPFFTDVFRPPPSSGCSKTAPARPVSCSAEDSLRRPPPFSRAAKTCLLPTIQGLATLKKGTPHSERYNPLAVVYLVGDALFERGASMFRGKMIAFGEVGAGQAPPTRRAPPQHGSAQLQCRQRAAADPATLREAWPRPRGVRVNQRAAAAGAGGGWRGTCFTFATIEAFFLAKLVVLVVYN